MLRLFALLLLLSPHPAHAVSWYSFSGWAGYTYGDSTGSVAACNPQCNTFTATFVVPTITYSGSGHTEQNAQWIGIEGQFSLTPDLNNCPGADCLGQFGIIEQVTTGGTQSYQAWWQLFCTNGSSSSPFPCSAHLNTISLGLMPVSPGDKIRLTMACVTGDGHCVANDTSQHWTVTIENLTQSVTWNNVGTNFNWPLGFGKVIVVSEATGQAGGSWAGATTTIHFSDVQMNSVPITFAYPRNQANYLVTNPGTVPRSQWPGPPKNSGNGFDVCYEAAAIGSALLPCGGTTTGSTTLNGQ